MVGIFSEEVAETFRMMLQWGAIDFITTLDTYLRRKYRADELVEKRRDCFKVWEERTDESIRRREADKLIESYPFLPNIYKIVASKYVKRLYDFLTEDRYVVKFSLPDFTLFYHRFLCAITRYRSAEEGDFIRSDFEESRVMQVRDGIRHALQTCLVNNLRVLDKMKQKSPAAEPRSTTKVHWLDGHHHHQSDHHRRQEKEYEEVRATTHDEPYPPVVDDEGYGQYADADADAAADDDPRPRPRPDDDDDDDGIQQLTEQHHRDDDDALPDPIEPIPLTKKSDPKKPAFDWHALDVVPPSSASSSSSKSPRPSVNVRSAPPAYAQSLSQPRTVPSSSSNPPNPPTPKPILPPPTPSTVERFLNTPAELALAGNNSNNKSSHPGSSSSAELLRL